ncbi:hypothetical protein, partial [Mesorhizobium sp.]|uniref:hypothetical protein n=1 Tax=Mesorhizobium sp. TaxID=1871066 RepID=UPI00257BCEC8
MNAGRINLRSGQQSLRVSGKRVSQAGNIELAIVHLLFGNDDARLGLQSRHIGLPALRRACFGAHITNPGDVEYRSACRKLSGRRACAIYPGVGSLTLGNDAIIDDRK